MHSPQTRTVSPQLPEWYQYYYQAVLEGDSSKMPIQIERAAKAITERLLQLRSGATESPQEFQDLDSALTYLRLLSDTIDPYAKRLI